VKFVESKCCRLPLVHHYAIMASLSAALVALLLCIISAATAKFQSSSSSTFVDKVELPVVASRFDRSSISMNIVEDVVTFGPYIVKTRIGVIRKHDPLFLEHCDGILGLGWEPNSTDPSSALIQTLILGNKMEWKIPQPDGFTFLRPRRFALVATHDSGELQMGGYDPEAVLQPPFMMPVTPGYGYGIVLTDLSMCGMSLLPTNVPFIGILDSGDSCIGLPSEKIGYTEDAPINRYVTASQLCKADGTFNIAVKGHTFSMPVSEVQRPLGCVKRHSMPHNIIILGDPVFRAFLVLHDFTDIDHPRVGLAPRNHNYAIALDDSEKLHLEKSVRHIPLESQGIGVRYYANVGIGTPSQGQRMLVDTGSVLLAVLPSYESPNGFQLVWVIPTIIAVSLGSAALWVVRRVSTRRAEIRDESRRRRKFRPDVDRSAIDH
jgi:hypothetical protein